MALFGLRTKLKTIIKDVLHLEEDTSSHAPTYQEPPVEPSYEEPVSNPEPTQTTEKVEEPQPVVQEEQATPVVAQAATEAATEGKEMTPENVQEVLDDDVRPALQMDGGDIELIKVEDNNIYVRLVGACSTCPSSVMTMRMGVENLLREVFPSLNELIEVTAEESA